MTADKLGNLLNHNKNSELETLVERARSIGALTETLIRALPAELAGSIVAANVREDGELVVVCPTSARAARLRYETEALMKAARDAGRQVARCTVRVTPNL